MMNSSSSNESVPINSFRQCLITRPSSIIYTTFILINVFLFLPLYIFILCYGLQKWWKNRSKSSASTMSHSDCFTYHLVIMELVGVVGCSITFGGIYKIEKEVVIWGDTLFSLTWYGEGFFHILTCVEHYLAVVHPITYVALREQRGIRFRNIAVSCVWLLCSAGVVLAKDEDYIVMDSLVIILTVIIIPFCLLSVLRALNHSGPGEQGTGNEQVDQSKQRAFYTILVIVGVLLLRFVWTVVWFVNTLRAYRNCVLMTCETLFNLPSNLMLPLLFLQRAGKLTCWKNIQ